MTIAGEQQFEFDAALAADELDEGWTIGNAVNGGLSMARLVSELAPLANADGDHPDCVAISAYFLSAARPGPYAVDAELVRVGRTMSTGQASLRQSTEDGEVERIRALATFADLAQLSEPVRRQGEAPTITPPQDCFGLGDLPDGADVEVPAIMERLDMRLDPPSAMWGLGQASGRGRMDGWLRLQDGREPDAHSLVFFLDAFPPVAFDLGLLGWAPTLEFTGYVRAHPAPGWLQVELTTENFSGTLLEENCRIWDSTGRLVAQSRQLAAVRVPSAEG
ncbi:MAG: thioesterase family protein [Actinomycetia bacterium]|nr:thioesterase family protein [Actinomycetes bacterium]